MRLQCIVCWAIAGGVLVALASACSHSGEPVQEPGLPATARPAQAPLARAELAVPTLLGLTVDELAQKLGPAQPLPASVQAQLGQMPVPAPADSLRYFKYRSLELLVSYNATTGRSNDLLLLGSNEDVLMQRAGLALDAANYLLLPVFQAHRPMQMLALRVVPVDPRQLQ